MSLCFHTYISELAKVLQSDQILNQTEGEKNPTQLARLL